MPLTTDPVPRGSTVVASELTAPAEMDTFGSAMIATVAPTLKFESVVLFRYKCKRPTFAFVFHNIASKLPVYLNVAPSVAPNLTSRVPELFTDGAAGTEGMSALYWPEKKTLSRPNVAPNPRFRVALN